MSRSRIPRYAEGVHEKFAEIEIYLRHFGKNDVNRPEMLHGQRALTAR